MMLQRLATGATDVKITSALENVVFRTPFEQ